MFKLAHSLGVLAALSLLAAVPARAENGTLKIWIGDESLATGLAKVGEKFTKATGIKVVVERQQDVASRFQQAASGTGPDILIAAHDRVGRWVNAGLLEPVVPVAKLRSDLEETGWKALTAKGKIHGYPLTLDAVGLIYNKALVPTPPKTFEELIALDKQLQKAGKHAVIWDHGNPYYSFPLLAANGGYAFGLDASGSYVASDVGVNNAGAIQGAQLLVKLIDAGAMPKGVSYASAEAAMTKGEVAMLIAGPGAWSGLKKSKIDLGVAALPSVGGKPAKAFVGVRGLLISSTSTGKPLAREFIEKYLLTMDGLKTLDPDPSLGVPAHKEFYRSRATDPLIAGAMRCVASGALIPNIPEIDKFWPAMQSALADITQGRSQPKGALDKAAARIKAP